MGNPQKITITSTDTPHIRVGLKWEPREIDHIKFITASSSDATAYLKFGTETGFSALYSMFGTLARNLSKSPDAAKNFDASADVMKHVNEMKKAMREEMKGPAYNLDLLCFKYDSNKKLVGMISPYSIVPRNADKAQLAILHSGDDPDGVGVGFDEEIMINLGDVEKNVSTVFFVVSSENYGFSKIKGGLCSLIRTQDEQELIGSDFTAGGDQQTFVFAGMRRTGDGWTLEKIADFITVDADKQSPLDDTIDDILRNKYC